MSNQSKKTISSRNSIKPFGIGVLLAADNNDRYSRPKELRELGVKAVFRDLMSAEDIPPHYVVDMPFGKRRFDRDPESYPYTDFERSMREGGDEKEINDAMVYAINELSKRAPVYIYFGALDSAELRQGNMSLDQFKLRAMAPLIPFLTNDRVRFVFDGTNRDYIDDDHRVGEFLNWLTEKLSENGKDGEERVVRESLPRIPDQYRKHAMTKIDSARSQLERFPPETLGRVHLFYSNIKAHKITIKNGKEIDKRLAIPHHDKFDGYATPAWWIVWCHLNKCDCTIAEHVLSDLKTTPKQLLADAQALLDGMSQTEIDRMTIREGGEASEDIWKADGRMQFLPENIALHDQNNALEKAIGTIDQLKATKLFLSQVAKMHSDLLVEIRSDLEEFCDQHDVSFLWQLSEEMGNKIDDRFSECNLDEIDEEALDGIRIRELKNTQLQSRVDELEKLARRLPVTKDGVRCPEGSSVYHPEHGELEIVDSEAGRWEIREDGWMYPHTISQPESCYSTPEAALAARGGE